MPTAVDHVRKELESTMEPAITEMRREIQSMLNRLGSKVKNMKMADFLRECGGDVQGFIEKDKRQAKCVRRPHIRCSNVMLLLICQFLRANLL